ncbi:nitroreductase [Entomomonas sp. E2T0]|uniref:nitroreductase family protein n=1 Tax=Entomomonas sp. E2T0 TaxID=2930213 RepID=UPI00222846F7|nr:nitroreductase [Entomomonas sp. E2T0]UYZ84779.1 nitroreductase [Entomomonas sp. E2T0]
MSNMDTQEILNFLRTRRSAATPTLTAPGPTPEELTDILNIGLRTPDHGKIEPWRLLVVEGDARKALGTQLAKNFALEKNTLTEKQQEKLTQIVTHTVTDVPLIIYVISCIDKNSHIPELEQLLSAGAVCMNILWAVNAYGYGANWISGWLAYSEHTKKTIGIKENEEVAGVIFIGSTDKVNPERKRPDLKEKVNYWSATE